MALGEKASESLLTSALGAEKGAAGQALNARDAPESSPKRGRNRQAVLVLGMHRSGTSAITQALSHLGGRLPKNLLPAAPDNPRGFFESKDIVEIHDRVLASAGTSWHDWDAFPESWYGSIEPERYVQELSAVLEASYGDARLFLLKDPRICRFLPLWIRVSNQTKSDLFAVLPFRNPLEVARSLRDRNGLSTAHGLLLWLRHVLDSEASSRELPRVFLSYEEFVSDGRLELDRLHTHLPLVWPRQSARAYHEIESSIDAGLRRSKVDPDGLYNRHEASRWVRAAYEAYEKLRADPKDKQAMADLDRIRDEYNVACSAFAPAFQGIEAHLEQQAAELEKLREDLARSKQAVSEAQHKAAELEMVAAKLPKIEKARDEFEQALAAANNNLAEQAAVNLSLQDQVEEGEKKAIELGVMAQRFEQLEGQSRSQQELISQLEQALSDTQNENQHLISATAAVPKLQQENQRLAVAVAAERARVNAETLPMIARVSELDEQLKNERKRVNALSHLQHLVPSLEERACRAEAELRNAVESKANYAAEADSLRERIEAFEAAVRKEAGKKRPRQGVLYRFLDYGHAALTLRLSMHMRDQKRSERRRRVLLKTGLFDPDWYLSSNPDVWIQGLDPVEHFCERGYVEGRSPGPSVDTSSLQWLLRQLETA